MDNLDIYLYIIILVIYAVARIFKTVNKKPPVRRAPGQSGPDQGPNTKESPQKRPFSFEDILREFEQSFKEETAEPEVEVPMRESHRVPPPVPVSESPKPAAPTVSPYQTYEGLSYEDTTPEVLVKPSADKPAYARNEKYVIGKRAEHYIIKKIKSPGGLRDAIMLNEIINRKYF